ncbi:TPA: hypothetical protein ACHT7U_004906 [Escherichia coli]|uniref:hypothetical protein n=1 Tax=Escherichia coli TaxID=562 RepID=UPI0017C788AD|nr:hypothetical protein [Escherichia coli]MDA6781189.1 hypothetical protein [Escherichia coli]MDO2837268.1 hypothetical protein [Escherichia coli]HAJ0703885.1 hypothetical protein [Escherichia coli]HAX8179962.1 hypothetical protein [Escherichia coli]HBE7578937.1 hypothetical protein [Escherichia coli]
MNKKITGLLIISLASIFLIDCTHKNKKDRFVYVINNKSFLLTKECVSEIKMGTPEIKDNNFIFIKLKEKPYYSEEFNKFIADNIGSDMKQYFNGKLIGKIYMASKLTTENGYRQMLPNRDIGKEIISAYTQ